MRLAYLDHNASTPISPLVLEAMVEAARLAGNPSAVHQLGKKNKLRLDDARTAVLNALALPVGGYKVVFTSSGTESNNLALHGFAKSAVLASAIEHSSVLKLAADKRIAIDGNGVLSIANLLSLLEQNRPEVISVMYANNETGVIQPLAEVAAIAKQRGVLLHTDATQALGKVSMVWGEFTPDLISISAHKFGGPLGAAALVYRQNLMLKPIMQGGGQEFNIRPGTQNVPAIVGMAKACQLLPERLATYDYVRHLRNQLEVAIKSIYPEVMILGAQVPRLHNTSAILMPGVAAETQVIHFDLAGICLSSGAACSSGRVEPSYVYQAMGLASQQAKCVLRVSLGPQNNQQDIDSFCHTWHALYNKTKGGTP